MGVVEAVPEPRVNVNIGIGAIKFELPGCARWSSIEPLNQMLEAFLGAIEALLGVAELVIMA